MENPHFKLISNLYGFRLVITSFVPLFISIIITSFFPNNLLGTVLAAILLGITAYRVQFILHEASHFTLFKPRFINDAVANFTGSFIGFGIENYRKVHQLHHLKHGHKDDPQFFDFYQLEHRPKFSFLLFLLQPLWASRLAPTLKRDILSHSKLSTSNTIIFPSTQTISIAFIQLLILVFITTQFYHPAKLYLAPSYYIGIFTISLFLARLRAIAEHQPFPNEPTNITRNHKPNLIDSLFLSDGYFCFHETHHSFPSVQSCHYPSIVYRDRDAYCFHPSMLITILRLNKSYSTSNT